MVHVRFKIKTMFNRIDVKKHNPKKDLTTHWHRKDKLTANIIEMLTKWFCWTHLSCWESIEIPF
jgi:hypothetical protein